MNKVLMYAGFERFWHWSQAVLIFTMLLTGFEIHGTYQVFGFEQAVSIHTIAAWLLIGLWIFAWFWHVTTGEWKQYIPSSPKRILMMLRYFVYDIFQGKAKPFHKVREHKLNPLQRMAYLALHVAIGPAIWISGLFYLFYNEWSNSVLFSDLPLGTIALIHTAAAFLMMVFIVVHLYLALTMDKRPFTSLRAMITGYELQDD